VLVFEVGVMNEGNEKTSAVFVWMYRLELRDENDPFSECVKSRLLEADVAVLMVSTFLSHNVVPILLKLDHRRSHYEFFRPVDEDMCERGVARDEERQHRICSAMTHLGLYAPSPGDPRVQVEQPPVCIDECVANTDMIDLCDFTESVSLYPPPSKKYVFRDTNCSSQ